MPFLLLWHPRVVGGTPPAPPVAVVKTGTGGVDPPRRRRTIVKPTGLLDRKVEKRVEQAHEVAREVTREMRERFTEEPGVPRETLLPPIADMSGAQIDAEIGQYLRAMALERARVEEDEDFLMMLMLVI